MSADTWTQKEEIESLVMERPHVVVLGAGASYAALPDGDRYGRKLPLMNNFVHILGLGNLLQQNRIIEPYDDFEAIYSDITVKQSKQGLKRDIEEHIRTYFNSLELPENPTLYDHLILSLRPKDVIATFNWDPFLSQAIVRNLQFIKKPPQVFFLHGNVTYAYCHKCKIGLPLQTTCTKCGETLQSAPLLYPVKEKNYQSNPTVQAHWRGLEHYLKKAWAITIFGYNAPKSDIEAVKLMKDAWGETEDRNLEQTEIIDIQSEEELVNTWGPFIHSHHYEIHRSFYDSIIAEFPRRSGEALWAQLMECKWLDPQKFPKNDNFSELYRSFIDKISYESGSRVTLDE